MQLDKSVISTRRKIKRIEAKPGDVLPIVGMKAVVVGADGNLIRSRWKVLEQRIRSTWRADETGRYDRKCERSVGVQITFGKLKLLDLEI